MTEGVVIVGTFSPPACILDGAWCKKKRQALTTTTSAMII